MKKFLTSLLCVMMIVAMMPGIAMATGDEGTPEGQSPETESTEQVTNSEQGETEGETATETADTFVEVATYEELLKAFEKDNAKVKMTADITADAALSSGYGKTGVVVLNPGDVLDGGGHTIIINEANGTWDSAINIKGGEVKNITIGGAFRGIFIGGTSGDIIIDNVHIDNVGYTINVDDANTAYGLYVSNSTLNGWTSYTNKFKEVVFTGCTFGAGTGGYKYAFCRPYQATTFNSCEFENGFMMDYKGGKVEPVLVFNNCTYNGVALSADNNDMFYNGGSVTIDGVVTDVNQYTAKIGTQGYDSLAAALTAAAASETATKIDILEDATYDNAGGSTTIIPKADITINGNGHEVTTTTNRMFRFAGGESAVTVTINDLDITSTVSGGRCIETRGANITLNLNDVNLSAEVGSSQALTVGGNHTNPITINIDGGSIEGGTSGYAITTFNPVNLNVNNGNAVAGYAAMYFKGIDGSAGSDGTIVNITGSTIASENIHSGESNSFGTFVFEDDNVDVNVTNSTLKAAQSGDIHQLIVGFKDVTGCDVVMNGSTAILTGNLAYFANEVEGNTAVIKGGYYAFDPTDYVSSGTDIYLKGLTYYVATAPAHSSGMNTWVKGNDGIYTETYVEPYIPPVDPTPVTPAPSTPKEDIVTNTTTNTDTAGTTVVAPTTNADVSASTTTTKTETGEAKTETKVEQTVADKIVEKAVENKSEEVVIDTTTKAPTTGTTTTAPAEETKAAEVVIPTETIEKIATQTEAAVTIKTDVAEIKLDNAAATAIAEQAAEEGTISIVAVKTDEVVVEETTAAGETKAVTEVHFELKVVCSERGVIGDFKGGEVTVTVPVPKDMQTEELVCVYIDAQGHYHRVTGVKNANGTFSFTTDHFSSYAVMTAEEAEKAIAEQKAKVESAKLKLRSANAKTSKGKKAIKLTVSEVTDTGIDFDGYVIYRSTKKTSGFKKIYTTKTGTYYNTAVKAGTKYYYKAKGFVTIDGEKVYTGWSLKAIRTAK